MKASERPAYKSRAHSKGADERDVEFFRFMWDPCGIADLLGLLPGRVLLLQSALWFLAPNLGTAERLILADPLVG